MPILDLGPFRRQLRKQKVEFEQYLARGGIPETIAEDRTAIEIMEEDLAKGEAALKIYTEPTVLVPGPPANRWKEAAHGAARYKLFPYYRDKASYDRKVKEYEDYADQLLINVNEAYNELHETTQSRQVWIVRHNMPTRLVIKEISSALRVYRKMHEPDKDFLYIPAKVAVDRMLEEDRVDLGIMLRLALRLPMDTEQFVLENKERPAWHLAISLLIGVIPIVGSAVAVFEAYRGKDIFGYELSEVERGILVASVLLPAAFRLVKAGRAMYTAERMTALYGSDAKRWSYAMALGERLSDDVTGLQRLKAADELVAAEKKIIQSQAEGITDLFKSLGLDSTSALVKQAPIEAEVVKLFQKVVAKHPKLAALDPLALQRIAAKGVIVDHVKGQILEELLETQITKFLSDPYGRIALGLGHIKGPLHFVPGHLIRDGFGLQLTDGLILQQVKEKLRVVAVFEAKSGKSSAQKLGRKFSPLTDKDKVEYIAEAKESLKELQERARIAKQPAPSITLDDLMKEIKRTEWGGQIRSDLERLSELELYVNGQLVPEVIVGPRSTKWFGIIPRDIKGEGIKESIRQAGIPNVEIMGLGITQNELINAARTIIKETTKAIAIK